MPGLGKFLGMGGGSPLLPGLPGQSPRLRKKQALPQFLIPPKLVLSQPMVPETLLGQFHTASYTVLLGEASRQGKRHKETSEVTLVPRSHQKASRRASPPQAHGGGREASCVSPQLFGGCSSHFSVQKGPGPLCVQVSVVPQNK